MRTASARELSSPIPGIFVWLYVQSIEQFVEAAEQVHYRHQLYARFIIKAKLPHRGSMY